MDWYIIKILSIGIQFCKSLQITVTSLNIHNPSVVFIVISQNRSLLNLDFPMFCRYVKFYYGSMFKKMLVNLTPISFTLPLKPLDMYRWPFVSVDEFDSHSQLTMVLSMTSAWTCNTRLPLWKCIILALRWMRSGNLYS